MLLGDDPNEQFIELGAYVFLGVSAQTTLTGYFVGIPTSEYIFSGGSGFRKGSVCVLTIPQADGATEPVGFNQVVFNDTTLAQSTNGTIPSDATGFIGNFSGPTYWDCSRGTSALEEQFETLAASLPWPTSRQSADNPVLFGRVHFGSK